MGEELLARDNQQNRVSNEKGMYCWRVIIKVKVTKEEERQHVKEGYQCDERQGGGGE